MLYRPIDLKALVRACSQGTLRTEEVAHFGSTNDMDYHLLSMDLSLIHISFCYTAVFTTVLHFIIHYKTFHYLPGSLTESIKVAGGFLLGLPHTATYFGQEFFSCGPMWYLLALLMGWILLDVILNIFPERYIPWAVGGAALLGWGASLVWELPFCLIQGAVITPYPVSYTHLDVYKRQC